MRDPIYWIWLQQALGVGATQSGPLLERFDTARDVYEAEELPLSLPLTPSQRRRLADKDLRKASEEQDALERLDAFVLTPEDAVYETLFKGMYAPPTVLYGRGTCFAVKDTLRVTVVGTRRADEAGLRATRRLAAGLAAGGAVIVSGGAEGLDSAAIEAALNEGGRVISFQACGLDIDYPKAVAPLRERLVQSGGMLLTEFPLGTTVRSFHFPIRNRLLAAASEGTLVTQAPKRSGALMTASLARDMGRDVFALPGTVGVACCEGSNELLKDGAILVTNAVDVFSNYLRCFPLTVDVEAAIEAEERATDGRAFLSRPAKMDLKVAQEPEGAVQAAACPPKLSSAAQCVYDALAEREQTAAELASSTELPLSEVLSSLTMLELFGCVTCGAGQLYARR